MKRNGTNEAVKAATNKKGKNMNGRNALLLESQPTLSLSGDVLRRAAELADGIATQQAELNQLLSGQIGIVSQVERSYLPGRHTLPFPTPAPHAGKGRRFSPEAIEKIRQAQRRRWRKARKNQAQATATAEATATNPATAGAVATPAVAAPVAVPAPAAPIIAGTIAASTGKRTSKKGGKNHNKKGRTHAAAPAQAAAQPPPVPSLCDPGS